MPIIIESNYSKKLGLPGYSSHSYSLTVRTELTDLSQLERESAKLYAILQGSVDREIQETGFVPEAHGSSRSNGHATQPGNNDQWAMSDKQRELILKIVEEHQLHLQQVEELAKSLFNLPIKALNKMQASGLIENLIEQYGPRKTNGNGSRSYQRGGRR